MEVLGKQEGYCALDDFQESYVTQEEKVSKHKLVTGVNQEGS